MKKNNLFLGLLILIITTTSCTVKNGINTDLSSLKTTTSSNINSIFDITDDNSGMVKITPTGEGVSLFIIDFGDGTNTASIMLGENITHTYPEGSYSVKITAKNITGVSTETNYPLDVVYRAPENITITKSISGFNLTLSAEASYAKSFLVFYGDVPNEVGTPLALEETLSNHKYPSSGNYEMKIVALSGGAATSEITVPITIDDPFSIPITFENQFVNYFFGTFDDQGQQQFATVDNPDKSGLNTSDKVGLFTNGHAGWSGTYSPLDLPIDFSIGKKITLLVYIPDAANIGKKLNVELESAVGGTPSNGVAVVKMPILEANKWVKLVFDYSSISGIPEGAKFMQIVFRYNDIANGSNEKVYIDNIKLTN